PDRPFPRGRSRLLRKIDDHSRELSGRPRPSVTCDVAGEPGALARVRREPGDVGHDARYRSRSEANRPTLHERAVSFFLTGKRLGQYDRSTRDQGLTNRLGPAVG